MPWNWQQPDWPNFSWNQELLRDSEARFLHGAGKSAGVIRHLDSADRSNLAVDTFTIEAATTSEIEGEILERASVQSSIRRQFGLTTENRRVHAKEEGIARLLVDLYRTTAHPLTEEMLFSWHRMLFLDRGGVLDLGRFRTGEDAMEVVSGPIHNPRIHFEAPPASSLPKEMARFVDWFNRSAAIPVVTRAGLAHLYFESIHPFEDGNGRIGRAISEKALSQTLDQPVFTALSSTILARRKEYYAQLETANKSNEVTAWLQWFASIVSEAQARTLEQIEFMVEKTRFLDRLRGQLNPRQEKALLRMLREGPEGFKGGLSAGNYSTITGASPATATRDLADLVEKGALLRTGERRHARYRLAVGISTSK